jgi:hypothetical protein
MMDLDCVILFQLFRQFGVECSHLGAIVLWLKVSTIP